MSTPAWFRREIYPGDSGSDVCVVQRLLGALVTGVMDEDTTARVRGRQRAAQGVITGVVDHSTAVLLGNSATYGLVPQWYGSDGEQLALFDLLHCTERTVENAVRRFQSHHHLPCTGVVDETTAIAIGD